MVKCMRKRLGSIIKNLLSMIEKYMDGICSVFIGLSYFFDWFYIEKTVQVGVICIVMELYTLYCGSRKLNHWRMLNIMLAFHRVALLA